MVGHTGNEQASIEAVESTDKCLSFIPAVLQAGGALIITADHGNVEEVRNLKTGEKRHGTFQEPVPLWFVTANNHRRKAPRLVREETQMEGLSDIAPPSLELMEIENPKKSTAKASSASSRRNSKQKTAPNKEVVFVGICWNRSPLVKHLVPQCHTQVLRGRS